MKHFLLWLALCAGLLGRAVPAHAQLSGFDSLQAKVSSVFGNLDKSQIPTGYFFEAAPKFFDWRYYNGTLTDTSLTDRSLLAYLRLITRAARLATSPADTLPDLQDYGFRFAPPMAHCA